MTEIITARIPRYIINWIDELVDKEIYKSRSEAIRDFLRNYSLEQHK